MRLHPDDRERVLAEDARCEQTGDPWRMEYRQIAKDGRVPGSAASTASPASGTGS
jgi:PAS fold